MIEEFWAKIQESGVNLKEMFKMLDLNQNGTLSKTELEAAFPVLGIKVWNKDVVKMLSLVDKDKNG